MPTLKHQIIRSIYWLGASNAFAQTITWVLTIFIARLLTPEDYGLVAMAAVYIGLAEGLNEFGIGAALIHKKDLHQSEIQAAYTFSITVGILLTCFSLLIAYAMALFFNESRLVPILHVLSITFIISSIKNIQRNLMIRGMKFKEIATIEAISRIFSSLLAFLSALSGHGVWALVLQYLSYNFLQAFSYSLCERARPGRIASYQQMRSILSYGLQVMTARFINYLSIRCDILVIGKLLGKTHLGIYSLALSLANKPIEKIVAIFNQVLFPVFSRLQDDQTRRNRYFLEILEIELLIILPVFGWMFLCAEHIVPLILGQKWLSIVFPLQIFSIVGCFVYIRSLTSMIVFSIGKPYMQIYFNTAVLIVMTISMILLGSFWGFTGILFSWIIFFPVLILVYFLIIIKTLSISIISLLEKTKLPLILNSLNFALCSLLKANLPFEGWIRLTALTLIWALSYLAILFLLDKNKLRQIFTTARFRPADGIV